MDTHRPSLSGVGAAVGRAITAVPREALRRSSPLIDRILATGGPDPFAALERYGRLARTYDVRTSAGAPYRRRTVERLAAAPDEVIVDVGCGTGLNFEALVEAIGPHGRLIGIDLCPEMLDQAEARVQHHGWQNVELVEAAAEDAQLPAIADAAVLCGVHDVMRSPAALDNVLAHVREGGRIVAGGPKWAPWWRPGAVALNLSTWAMNRDYITTLEGLDCPWSHLAELLPTLQLEEVYFGGGYIAWGVRAPEVMPDPNRIQTEPGLRRRIKSF